MLLEINSTLVFLTVHVPQLQTTLTPVCHFQAGRSKVRSLTRQRGPASASLLICGTAAAELGARQGGSAQSWAPGEALRLGWSALEARLLSGFDLNSGRLCRSASTSLLGAVPLALAAREASCFMLQEQKTLCRCLRLIRFGGPHLFLQGRMRETREDRSGQKAEPGWLGRLQPDHLSSSSWAVGGTYSSQRTYFPPPFP